MRGGRGNDAGSLKERTNVCPRNSSSFTEGVDRRPSGAEARCFWKVIFGTAEAVPLQSEGREVYSDRETAQEE